MRLALVVLVAAALVGDRGRAQAAPAADLVVLWLPGQDAAPIAGAARAAGAAVLDRTPPAPPAAAAAATIARAIDAYHALRFDEAWEALAAARAEVDRHGGAELTAAGLSDLALYRGLVQLQRDAPEAAWDELVVALTIAPARVFDPGRFPPRVIEELERVRRAVLARPRVELAIDAPPGCAIVVDGAPVTAAAVVTVIAGGHWVAARCDDGARWGARVDAVGARTPIAIALAAARPPADDELVISARSSGARAVVVVAAGGELATLRVLGLDGRERDRRTVALADGAPAIAAALTGLLRAPPPAPARTSRARWWWAAGAAALAVAIAIPVTAAVAGGDRATDVTVRGPGDLP